MFNQTRDVIQECASFVVQDVDEAALNRIQLERKIESLQDEINFLKKTHDEVRTKLQM